MTVLKAGVAATSTRGLLGLRKVIQTNSMFAKLGEAEIRVSELEKCFYCGGSLPAKNKEHIFNSCWGGSHKTSRLICDICNAEFSKIDSSLSIYTTFVMNAWAFKGERHKKVPEIVTEDEYNIGARAKPKLKTQQGKIKALPDGSLEISLSFRSKNQAYKWLDSDKPKADLGRSLTEEERQCIRQVIQEAKPESIDVGPQKLSYQLNWSKEYRSAAHTLLKCLGLYTPDWVCSDLSSPVREFARYDKGSWVKFAVEVHQHLSISEQKVKGSVHCNTAEIYWCCSLEMVVGVITLLGRVKRAVVIAEGYRGPDAILAVIEDTSGSTKPPQSFFIELDPELPSLPLIEIQNSPPSIKSLGQELSHLAAGSLPLDGLMASLLDSMEKIARETPEINMTVLQKYEKLFVDFASGLEKAFGVSVKLDEVPSKLATYGFSDLAQYHIGKSCKDNPEILSIFETACSKLIKELTDPLFSRRKS